VFTGGLTALLFLFDILLVFPPEFTPSELVLVYVNSVLPTVSLTTVLNTVLLIPFLECEK
jgi:hypothetical protein